MKNLEKINQESIEFQERLTTEYKKQNGIYYTDIKLAYKMVSDMLNNSKILEQKNIYDITFLEPCGGMGNFVFAYLEYIHNNFNLTKKQYLSIVNNIFLCEPNEEAKNFYKNNLKKICDQYFNIKITEKDIHIGNSLIYDLKNINPKIISIKKYFNINKFDIIITNPPYKNLRAEKTQYKFKSEYNFYKEQYENIKMNASKNFKYSKKIGANLFKYFVEEIITKLSKENSLISFLIPISILTDKSCLLLRKLIISKQIKIIGRIPEKNNFINAKQSMVYFIINNKKTNYQDNIKITKYNSNKIIKEFFVKKENLISKDNNRSIILIDEEYYDIFSKMNNVRKLKDIDSIINKRGELDISMNKNDITNINTGYRLVKGRNIHKYKFVQPNNGYVKKEFINNKNYKYIMNKRIACQQVVNLSKKERLIFTIVPPKYVLGNSCNFLLVKDDDIDINYILGILNSKIINWYFKLFSSNNHINNYQLDNIPIPIVKDKRSNKISKLVGELLNNKGDKETKDNIDNLVLDIFINLDDKSTSKNNKKKENILLLNNDIENIVSKEKENISLLNKENILLNNKTYKLSNLDLEMIESIPEGGNWKNIPQKTVNKSKRLMGIQKSGGRTTLYGRLDYNKPSYTITTYFNRPGNGCYIHPRLDRVLTTREGARLQSFPDDYYFYGNQKDKLNQIGNAVPPLIGYQIGYNIINKIGCNVSTELFSGCGGLLSGMKHAGIKCVAANDFDKSACISLKINNPNVNLIHGDITDEKIKNKIVEKSLNKKVDIVSGGPPCQGFSLAGFRKNNDPRNELFKDFYDVLSKIKPKVFVFENVPGLLSYKNGKTFKDIKTLFQNTGYNLVAHKLDFSNYGIPQRRKRVIVIGVRNDIKINPELLFPKPLTIDNDKKITVKDAIKSIESMDHNGDFPTNKPISKYEKYITGEISIKSFYELLSK